MKIFIGGLIILLFLFSPFPVFAAISIVNVSPAVINSPDDILKITATASGLTNSTQYLQIGFTKDGEPVNYFGFTKNLSDEWYSYKSSPLYSNDLTQYFYKFTPSGGSWTGEIFTKIDISDSGFKGPGSYSLKLLKYISSSSPTYSVNFSTVMVNITPSPSPAPTSTPTSRNLASSPPPSKTPTPTKILSPTNKLTVSAVPSKTKNENVLGEATASISAEPTKEPQKEVKTLAANENRTSQILIGIGFVFLIACGIVAGVQKIRKEKLIDE